MDKKSILKKYLPTGLLLAAAAAIGITGATVLHNMTLENPIKTPPVDITIEEKLGDNGTKEARFINNGEADAFLRVTYSEGWVYIDEKENKEILKNEAMVLDNEGKETGEKIKVAVPQVDLTNWYKDAATGWYYYKKILPGKRAVPGDTDDQESMRSTPNFTTEVKFNYTDSAGNEIVDAEKYKNAEYQLHFTVEVVQASDEVKVSEDAVQQLFKKDIVLEDAATRTTDDGRILWETESKDGVISKYDATVTWSDITGTGGSNP